MDYLKSLINDNLAIGTLFSGGIVATLVMHSKSIFYTVKDYLLNMISFDITNINNEKNICYEYYNNFDVFLKNQKPLFQRNYEISCNGDINVGYGTQWYIMFGKLVSVRKNIQTTNGTFFVEIYMRVYFANKNQFLEKLKDNVKHSSNIFENKVKIYFNYDRIEREKRNLNSIYMNDNAQYKVFNDLKKFIHNKQFYRDNNIPYKRNYLLYGKPGTGKTSLIFSLASELNYDIRIIDISTFNDFLSLLSQIRNNSSNTFLIFEDIDAISNNFDNCRYVNESPAVTPNIVSLASLLNILDGFYTKEGMITFFTTNHIEKLDDAFLRDGRMDYKLELNDLNNSKANEMIYEKTGLINAYKGESINPSTLQEIILRYKSKLISKDEFLNNVNKGDANE